MQVQEKHEPEGWRNCTQISKSLMCTINDLKSNTVYVVRVAGRNVVGYSEFTVKETQTLATNEEHEPKGEIMSNTLTTRLLRLKVVSIAGSFPGVLVTGRHQGVSMRLVTWRKDFRWYPTFKEFSSDEEWTFYVAGPQLF